jgi:hypothetical protein
MKIENSLCSYHKQVKLPFLFSFRKLENRRVEQILPGLGGVGTSGREEEVKKGYRRVNMVRILCTHLYKLKTATCLNYSRNGRRRNKGD